MDGADCNTQCNTQSTRLQQGDCARMQVMHTVGLMDRLLKGQGLDLAILTYNVIATSFEVGLVECGPSLAQRAPCSVRHAACGTQRARQHARQRAHTIRLTSVTTAAALVVWYNGWCEHPAQGEAGLWCGP